MSGLKRKLVVAIFLAGGITAPAVTGTAADKGTAVPDNYKVTIKEFSLCEDSGCSAKTTLFTGNEVFDIATLNRKEVQELIPGTTIIKKGNYTHIRLVLQNRFLMQGSAPLDAGEYCATDSNAERQSLSSSLGNKYGVALLTDIVSSPNAQEREFWLPYGKWQGANWTMSVSAANTTGNISIILKLSTTITVPQDIKMESVSDPIRIYFDVEEGVESYKNLSGLPKGQCLVVLGAPILYVTVGRTTVVKGAQPQVQIP